MLNKISYFLTGLQLQNSGRAKKKQLFIIVNFLFLFFFFFYVSYNSVNISEEHSIRSAFIALVLSSAVLFIVASIIKFWHKSIYLNIFILLIISLVIQGNILHFLFREEFKKQFEESKETYAINESHRFINPTKYRTTVLRINRLESSVVRDSILKSNLNINNDLKRSEKLKLDLISENKKLQEQKERAFDLAKQEFSSSKFSYLKVAIKYLLSSYTLSLFAFTLFFLPLSIFFALIVSINDMKENIKELRVMKEESKKNINHLFEQQIKSFSYVQHELGNKLPAVKSELSFLKKLLTSNTTVLTLQSKVRTPLEGEDYSTIDTVANIFDRIEEGLNYSLHSLTNASEIISASKQELHLEEFCLYNFLNGIKDKTVTSKVNYCFSGDVTAKIRFDLNQFTTVINNIVENAIRHHAEKISFNIKDRKKIIELLIENNGDPIADDFTIEDFLTPHRYNGEFGNSGMGGYYVGIILKKHSAKIDLLPYKQDEEFKVKFLITFEK